MHVFLRTGAAALIISAAASAAQAQAVSANAWSDSGWDALTSPGWYLVANGGTAWPRERRLNYEADPGLDDFSTVRAGLTVKQENGIFIAAALGKRFGHIRAEMEVGHLNAGNEQVVVENGELLPDDGSPNESLVDGRVLVNTGSISMTTAMVHAYLDSNYEDTPLKLYLGLGLGAAAWESDLAFNLERADAGDDAIPVRLNRKDTDFAMAGTAGLEYRFTTADMDIGEIHVGLAYRYMQVNTASDAGNGVGKFTNNSVFATLRRYF